MKHLHEKNEQFTKPDPDILDTFPNPGVNLVTLRQMEFTSVCPLTHQPDYCTVDVEYEPANLCVESKSLKLYLASYRQEGAFAETLAVRICEDLLKVTGAFTMKVTILANPRGGIAIKAVCERRQ